MRYDAAYTAFPLCAPGRACLMTGRHASEIGAWDNGALLAADQPTFAHYLSDAGYDTVLSGKMHFIGPDQLHGFRRRLTTDIYSSDFNWVKPEWIRLKETGGTGLRRGDEQPVHVQCERLHRGRGADRGVAQCLELRRGDPTSGPSNTCGPESRMKRDAPFLLCASYHHPPRTLLAAPGLLEPVRRRRDRPAFLSRGPGRSLHHDGPEPERLSRHGAVRPAGRGRPLPAPAGLLRPGELHGRQGRRPAGRPRRDRTGGEHGGGLRQ